MLALFDYEKKNNKQMETFEMSSQLIWANFAVHFFKIVLASLFFWKWIFKRNENCNNVFLFLTALKTVCHFNTHTRTPFSYSITSQFFQWLTFHLH